jgi:DNA-binding response OmpR family regulator
MPIIFISGAPPEDLHDKVGNGSDVRFLQKPFGGRVLIEAIQAVLKRQQQQFFTDIDPQHEHSHMSGEPVMQPDSRRERRGNS